MLLRYFLIPLVSLLPLYIVKNDAPKKAYENPYVEKFDDYRLPSGTDIWFDKFTIVPTNDNSLAFNLRMRNYNTDHKDYKFQVSYINNTNREVNYGEELLLKADKNYREVFVRLDLYQIPKNINIHLRASCYKITKYIDIPINLTNPLYMHRINDSNRINYMFEFFSVMQMGRTYYTQIRPVHPANYHFNKYYYEYFNFNNDLKIRTDRSNAIYEPYLYVKEESTRHFDLCTFSLKEFPYPYKFFTLNSFEDTTTGIFSFKFGKQYFVDPITHIMRTSNYNGALQTDNKVYMPLNEYRQFKKTEFGIYFKFNMNLVKYKVYYSFNINFDNNYFKDTVSIYKENGKQTSDTYLKEVII